MQLLREYLNSFSPISDQTWALVSKLFTEKQIKKQAYFIKENQMPKSIAFLEHGIFRAFYRNEAGKEYTNHIFTAPAFIGGYASLISGQKNQINQQALTDCDIYVANFEAFNRLYKTCPDLETIARKWAEKKFILSEQREIDIVLLTAHQRYELLIAQIPNIEQQIPQYHIAAYLGITPTQLSRIRRKKMSSK